MRLFFETALEQRWEGLAFGFAEEITLGHGRREHRRCFQVNLSTLEGTWADEQAKWKGLASLIRLESERVVGEKTTVEVRYYLSSLSGNARQAMGAIRSHWGVENRLHWVLDVVFHEDESRVRKDHAPANLSVMRHLALNLLRQEKTCKNGIKIKRSKAGWDNAYLFKVLDSCERLDSHSQI